ncbi:hypothetical protein HMPREF0083_00798 [Aneurinibacillus aneurinilyticus ATCC 12856]|uniref:Uncharacterized protein n=1 Tax=Aneurinibacillus aneurinilyticus ATCC 12856 TaxID=649747 RepID=U1X800_ANEAE|nr:hypothetical protein HMPREF0083_00798 [Aneurinibacillus aneurinilyticus ATCC 12856]
MIGRKRRTGAVRKRQLAFLLPERRAHPTSSFFRISYFQPRYHVKLSSVTYIHLLAKHMFYLEQYLGA